MRAAYWDLCVYFLSGIAEMGGYFQTLYFKHYYYWHERSFSVALIFQMKVCNTFK